MYEEGDIADGPNGPLVYQGGQWVPMGSGGAVARIVAPNPVRAAKEAQERARQASADARAERAQNRADAAAERAEREWNATHNPDGSPKKTAGGAKQLPDGAAKRYEEAINAFAALDRAVSGFQDDFAGNTVTGELENKAQTLLGTGTPGQADWWADFKSTDNILRNALFGASLTAGEKAAYEATSIKPSMTPQQVRQNLTRRLKLARDTLSRRTQFLKANGYNPDAIDALAGEYGDLINGSAQQRAETETPDPAAGVLPKDTGTDRSPPELPPENGPTPPDMRPASGATRYERDDRLAAQVASMINAGAGLATINAALKQRNATPISPVEYQAAQRWMKANPGKRYPASSVEAGGEVPLTMIERAAGSPYGAFTANLADAVTAGTTTALGGDKARGALDAMQAMNPGASLAGTAIGGVAGAMGAETALATRAPAALARFAPRIADALYGGLAGFNAADEGEGGMGSLAGAAAGVAGGALGEGAARGLGAFTRGVRNPQVQYLRDRGVPLTVGQTVGDNGRIGQMVKGIEDALTSIPGVGNMIDARRLEGLQAFNRAAFQDAAPPGATITDTGAAGLGQVRQAVSDAYSRALDPVSINANETQFIDDLDDLVRNTQRIPNVNGARDAAMAGLESRIDGAINPVTDTMTGRGFQEAYRGLARTAKERANSDYGYEVGQVMRQGQDALGEVLERQNPGAFDGFIEANAANRRANVLAQAINPNAADELITPAQLNRADFNSTSKLTSRLNAASGNRPFFDLANAGQAVLPSKLPDSGTPKRVIVGALTTGTLGGAGYGLGGTEGAGAGTGLGLAATGALALGGTRGAQRAMTALLADRPDAVIRIADQFDNNPALGQILRRLASGAGVTTGLALGTP